MLSVMLTLKLTLIQNPNHYRNLQRNTVVVFMHGASAAENSATQDTQKLLEWRKIKDWRKLPVRLKLTLVQLNISRVRFHENCDIIEADNYSFSLWLEVICWCFVPYYALVAIAFGTQHLWYQKKHNYFHILSSSHFCTQPSSAFSSDLGARRLVLGFPPLAIFHLTCSGIFCRTRFVLYLYEHWTTTSSLSRCTKLSNMGGAVVRGLGWREAYGRSTHVVDVLRKLWTYYTTMTSCCAIVNGLCIG